ncbi:hypothetical protein H6G81_11775 [Scytonema hofmannii FACHB-248]|uniref:Uncharacterized protein n=1 Tax=Scytonema hofmannii FACHB-248 TaxID=1842502 RepID=A0ABR8GPC2_9CYAN|nr:MULTISPECIES: hypothetical protein [Nostocales]MBD2605193.1 hypothetical protein [Scytonema hofmannii FACHB-248]
MVGKIISYVETFRWNVFTPVERLYAGGTSLRRWNVFTRKAEVRGQKALMLGVSIKTYFVGLKPS